jgi:hypothetical protein
MEWAAIAKQLIPVLIANAPAIITTMSQFFDWAKTTVQGAADAWNKPAEQITADELLAHIQQMNRQQAEIDARP